MACLKAGIVAVPVFPPNPSRKDTLVMFTKIVQACGATFALTSASYNHMKKLSSLKDAVLRFQKSDSAWPDNLTWIVLDHLAGGGGGTRANKAKDEEEEEAKTEIDPSNLAFLQFTSGSTSLPKGVMVTHHNLADNLVKITSELKAGEDTVVVSWLPQYHDMGLIGSYLGILYCGGSGYYMSPLTFLQRPAMWIEAVSKYRGTHLQAPNFAFHLTARKFKESTYRTDRDTFSIDLSCVKHIINAAEPVTEDSIESFCSVFCPLGLDRNVIFPTYGLAEHTVFVCSGGKQRLTVSKKALEVNGVAKIVMASDSTETSRLIGCGYPAKQNVNVQIVHTETFQALGEDLVGEIWIQSESKAVGYYGMPFETRRDFCAVIGNAQDGENEKDIFNDNDNNKHAAIDVSNGYLRTGDLGFLHRGELFICGRIKDLIIVGGRNYYPQDIEATAEASDTRFRPGCSAAFTVDPISGDNEQVALVLELREVPKASVSANTLYCSRFHANRIPY
jgi:Acyl-CoA synthetases (AMP-forming)/AMP-acid ligases II